MGDYSLPRILVLDDDKIQHLLLQKRFKMISTDIELVSFDLAMEALDFLRTNPVEKILTDLNLGVMDGWEFVDELEKINFTGKLFFLTGSIAPEDRNRAEKDPRVAGYFEKPLSETDLIQILTD